MKSLQCLLRLNALIMIVLTAFSCTEEEEETKEYMTGGVSFPMYSYIGVGDIITTTASGITEPSDVLYKWSATIISNDSIRSNTVTFTVPDTLGTFTITAVAQASGYYNSSNSIAVTTIDTTRNVSLTGLKYSDRTFMDKRDGMVYDIVRIGNLDWFAENLAWDGAGVAFYNSPVTATLFGRLYYWNEATGGASAQGLGNGPQGVCPEGWSVPTNEDWEDLASAALGLEKASFKDKWDSLGSLLSADAYLNGDRLWPYSPDNTHTNNFGWNALPTGDAEFSNSNFRGFKSYGFWWSSTEKNDSQAYYRYIYCDYGTFPMNFTLKEDFGACVRCVRLAR